MPVRLHTTSHTPTNRLGRILHVVSLAGFCIVTHALMGNVHILIAQVMHTGTAIGAQISAMGNHLSAGARICFLFSILPIVRTVLVILRLLGLTAGTEQPF